MVGLGLRSDLLRTLTEAQEQVIPISVFVAVLCLCLVIGHLLEENRWFNESVTAILIGCVTGTIILFVSKGKSSHILRFSEELFFIYLLPPIIFNAGFQVKKKQFFQNFFTIILFGVIGVFISSTIIAAGNAKSTLGTILFQISALTTFLAHDAICLGCWWLFPKFGFVGLTGGEYLGVTLITIISHKMVYDLCKLILPILFFMFSYRDNFLINGHCVYAPDETPLLYSLVFGEGVVNDATSVVLFNAIRKLDGNILDAWAALHAGLLTAYALKTLCFDSHSSDREIALMLLMAYLSYMLAELLSLSGILTVFFCGIVMSHYAWHNVTEISRITTRQVPKKSEHGMHVFATISFIAETFIFLYVGMDALDTDKWKVSQLSFGNSMGIWGTIMFLVLLGRAAFIFPLSALSNYMNRAPDRMPSITFKHQIIIWWAGLMRGAVSIALAFKQFTNSGVTWDPVNATMVTSTVIVVLFSTVVFGIFTKPLVNFLLPHGANSHQESKAPKEDPTLPLISMDESASTNLSRAKESLSMLLESPVRTIHSYWRKFDDTYMRPIFGGPCRNQSR
ncbi:Cation/H+ exchanger [Dillenia turbinata]|uniref:Cation/H+ exchanger n=1 Tax=Dillenia turbinata TaxID=194707 RepID=A0AAN8ZBR8_9MAGN